MVIKPQQSTDLALFRPETVHNPGKTWGETTGKLCTAGDTPVDNLSADLSRLRPFAG
jgi:hypothetical protein